VTINTATPEELESLPGIGPSLAQLVVAGRPYADVADLARVHGISERQVEQLRTMLTVSEPTRDLRRVSVRERIAAWTAAWSPSSLAGYGIGALVAIFFVFRWLRRMRRRRRNARTRAAFEDAERRRWEGHNRE
jgi:competence ComEA-like helix-hairpin-helix protein